MTTQSKSLRLADQLIQGYAWPGGYPLFGLFSDNGICCSDCARRERKLIGTTTGDDGWRLVAVGANWEDPSLYCDNCNNRIESAHAEDEAKLNLALIQS